MAGVCPSPIAGMLQGMDIDIRHDRRDAHGRYTLLLDGEQVGELDYQQADGRRIITHTGVRPEHGGQGLAARLAQRALDDARADGMAVDPRCSYVVDHLDRHPEHADLLHRPA
jgi:predicted GNAT family acetyltransferase